MLTTKLEELLLPKTTWEHVPSMSKNQLSALMDTLQKRVDSGRHTGADVQVLRSATQLYLIGEE